MIEPEGVLHFTIPVSNLDRSEAFYTQILGLKKIFRNDHMVFVRSGDDYVVLTLSEQPIAPNVGDKHEIHHAFRVSGSAYDAAKTFLASRGVRVFKEEDRQKGAFRGRSAYFHDPDRNVIEIIDLKEIAAAPS
jgi:catechol 2,3-dioxygenase-like lactoylglutathione lyase family enzyme